MAASNGVAIDVQQVRCAGNYIQPAHHELVAKPGMLLNYNAYPYAFCKTFSFIHRELAETALSFNKCCGKQLTSHFAVHSMVALRLLTKNGGPARTRTEDQGIHSTPPFPKGVDYLFTL